MKDDRNLRWTKHDLLNQYKIENPEWTMDKCWEKTNIIYSELCRLNKNSWDNTRTFFNMNTPFSFYDNKDSEFSNRPWEGT